MTVLITGSSGFVGNSVISRLYKSNLKLIAPIRRYSSNFPLDVQTPIIVDIANLSEVLINIKGVDTVIHIAAKAHLSGIPLSEYRKVNTEATLDLANTAAKAGVKRFIFLSSIGVNGLSNTKPFFFYDKPAPAEDYAVSKLEAETGLKQISADTGMEFVIIRPPLVYGPGAPGNFGRLTKLALKNLPLPLGAIDNKRSLVSLDNLVDLIITCIDHPKAANQTFLVSDDNDVSTTQLLQMMTRAAGKKHWLLPVPMNWLKLAGKLTGKQAVIERLCGNLQVDITHTKDTLGWVPAISVEEGIARCFSAKY